MRWVTISPEFDAYWYSCYLQGLRELVPAGKRHYSARQFPKFDRPEHFKFILHEPCEWRIFIDAKDYPSYDERGLEWCDVYAKVNLDPATSLPKVIAAGANFPMRTDGLGSTILHAGWTLAKRFGQAYRNGISYPHVRQHLVGWAAQYRHGMPECRYRPSTARPDYVFFSASLWKGDSETNRIRAMFLEACRAFPLLEVEGGFAPRTQDVVQGYEHLTVGRRYTHDEFIEKTMASVVVFNNPAVARCHSWRLAEFLALGKAIISIRLERSMPAPLIHGEHIHFVAPKFPSIRAAVQRLLEDAPYRHRLERGAHAYYWQHLRPAAVVRRLLDTSQGVVPSLREPRNLAASAAS